MSCMLNLSCTSCLMFFSMFHKFATAFGHVVVLLQNSPFLLTSLRLTYLYYFEAISKKKTSLDKFHTLEKVPAIY
ncbi:hypothetical protein RIF29_08141 [Crotalaria pallida]|uniref:Uncharacterized protein n=1 Tax=Crotalaria pallida TaxID=3830 RepID=A0AAN9J6P5_CROPI